MNITVTVVSHYHHHGGIINSLRFEWVVIVVITRKVGSPAMILVGNEAVGFSLKLTSTDREVTRPLHVVCRFPQALDGIPLSQVQNFP